MSTQRRSGILLHPTSLPGGQPVGSLGQEAFDFVDFLVAAGQSVWQILPLGPTGYGDCPYSSFSAFAGNPLLINLQQLVEAGNLQQSDLPDSPPPAMTVDYSLATNTIIPALNLAADHFKHQGTQQRKAGFAAFCSQHAHWLDDFSLFQALREAHNFISWQQWPEAIRRRDPVILQSWKEKLKQEIDCQRYQQFIFFEQWCAVKEYANTKGIKIFGDLPIFVAEDSADVWANQHLFQLDSNGRPTRVAGVPPDYFSPTGQRWGNPLYDWGTMEGDGFAWWLNRFRWNFKLFDLLRLDHFRGFCGCWSIPADEPTAENGEWVDTPGEHLFASLAREFDPLPIIAEDLGIITPDVVELRDKYQLPGMKILLFAFDSGDDNPYLPQNHVENSVVYTGTHDNNTTLGWWQALDQHQQQRVRDLLQRSCDDICWCLTEVALSSVAQLAIIPLQDILSLPAMHRMNTPGTAFGNWQWRYQKELISDEIITRLKTMSHLYSRNLCIPTEIS